MMYTLVVYNRAEGRLLHEQSFEQRRDALAARFDAEREHAKEGTNIEVVVLAARSRSDLMRTHSRYFLSLRDLADQAI